MRHAKLSIFLLLVFLVAFLSIDCSSGKNPVELSPQIPEDFNAVSDTGRSVIGVYYAEINPDVGTFTIEPVDRESAYHFPLSSYFNVLTITGYGWTPNFWADIKLTHPYLGSGIDGFDARVIAILPANPGVSFNYPLSGANANNSVILEPDGYTKLFDWVGGSIPGSANPFKAYFKAETNRVWSSSGSTFETQRWQMNISGFGGPLVYYLLVDVSTNFPSPPQPVIDNAPEPVQIETVVGEGLKSTGGSAEIEVTLLDWQGNAGIGGVVVEAPDLFTGLEGLTYSNPGPGPDEYVYTGTISNERLAPEGDYNYLVGAWDQSSGIFLYDEFTAHVDLGITFNLEEVTPHWLDFHPEKIFIVGKYAYTAGGESGLHVFDITDKLDPTWLGDNREMADAQDIHVSGDYAYVAAGDEGLVIVDIDPPESMHVVHTVDTPGSARDVRVFGAYAYVADDTSGLQIINITSPESAYIFNSVDTPGNACGVSITITLYNKWAFIADQEEGLQIIDILDAATASIVKTVETPGISMSVVSTPSYAYVADWNSGLTIIDVKPIGDAYVVTNVAYLERAYDVAYSDGYAYVAYEKHMLVVDVDPPESAFYCKAVLTERLASGIDLSGDYAYVATRGRGMQIIDINPPDSAFIADKFNSINNAVSISGKGNNVCVADVHIGFHLVDVSVPEQADIIVTSGTDRTNEVVMSDFYAYTAKSTFLGSNFEVWDIDPPESTYRVGFITNEIPPAEGLDYADGYAYVAGTTGLYVIDIDRPDSPYIVQIVPTTYAWGVHVSGDFAYVTDLDEGLIIVEIVPPETSSRVKTVPSPDLARGVYAEGGYAYVAIEENGLAIFDVDPYSTAQLVKTVFTHGFSCGVYVSDGFAYVAAGEGGLQIVDIDPYNEAYIVDSISTPYKADDVYVADNYAYVADTHTLRIIRLW